MILNDFCQSHRVVSCRVVNREKSSGKRLEQMWRSTDRHYPERGVSIQSLPRRSGNPMEEGQERVSKSKVSRTPGEQHPLNQLRSVHMHSSRLKWQAHDLPLFVPDPLCICYDLQLCGFVGILTMRADVSLPLLPLWEYFPPIGLSFPASIWSLYYHILSCFVPFGHHPLEAYFF